MFVLMRLVVIMMMVMPVIMMMVMRVIMIVGVPVPFCMMMLMLGLLRCRTFRGQHVHLGGGDSPANHLARLHQRPHVERRGRVCKYRKRDACIGHSAQQHVAADAGKTVQVGYTHRA